MVQTNSSRLSKITAKIDNCIDMIFILLPKREHYLTFRNRFLSCHILVLWSSMRSMWSITPELVLLFLHLPPLPLSPAYHTKTTFLANLLCSIIPLKRDKPPTYRPIVREVTSVHCMSCPCKNALKSGAEHILLSYSIFPHSNYHSIDLILSISSWNL